MMRFQNGLLVLLLTGCGHQVLGWPDDDQVPPTVSSTTPDNEASGVVLNTSITATFSEEMDPLTISRVSFRLDQGDTAVPGTVDYAGLTALFTPDLALEPNRLYRGMITGDVTDLDGASMTDDYVWTFTTGDVIDTTAPMVIATNPIRDAEEVATNSSVFATFDEPMDPRTLSETTFTLKDGTDPVEGTVTLVGVNAVFNPLLELDAGTAYTATITTGAEDLAGNALATAYTWEFTAGDLVDDIAPTVTLTNPDDDADGVSNLTTVQAAFSEAMDPATLSTATFRLTGPGSTPVAGSVTYQSASSTGTFRPLVGLLPGVDYTATITTGVEDLAGNALSANYVWTFTTYEIPPDLTPPVVILTVPADDASDVATGTAIQAVFSEEMAPASLNVSTMLLSGPGAIPVPGVVSYDPLLPIAGFVPNSELLDDTLYTFTITTGVMDAAGNTLAAPYVWTFTTAALPVPDTTPPVVILTAPADGDTDVLRPTQIDAAFSEAMDPATLTESSFTLTGPGSTPVLGVVFYDALIPIATFVPDANLQADTVYTATITTAASDLAGNGMASDYSWTFTTRAIVPSFPPTVVLTAPEDGATAIPEHMNLHAAFSEAMDPTTIDGASFRVQGPGSTPVSGTVSYNTTTAVATFNPTDDLLSNTVYTATITTGAADLSGSNLVAPYVWTFTTHGHPDFEAPVVVLTVPYDGAIDVPLLSTIVAVFNEPMDVSTINALTFLVTGPGSTPVSGEVFYDSTSPVATFVPDEALLNDVLYTAIVTTGATDLVGYPLAEDHVWFFSTPTILDGISPFVLLTYPLDEAVDVPIAATIDAVFSEEMEPTSITDVTFQVMGPGALPILGTVFYDAQSSVATFVPDEELLFDTVYTATVYATVTDLAGNPMVQDEVWDFLTVPNLDTTPPQVTLTMPEDGEQDVATGTSIVAAFSEELDDLTIDTSSFLVTAPGDVPVFGNVVYDPLIPIATFTPNDRLQPDTTYTVTITTDVTDLVGESMEQDYVWTFTTGNDIFALAPVDLGSLSTFVAVAGAGLTNSNSGGFTTLNGDVGLSPTGTCMGDGSPCTQLNPIINGTLYVNDPEGIAAQAKIDLIAAYVDAMSRPPGTIVADLSGMILPPGVYTSASTMSIAVGGTVVLDGQGDTNAVWIFQIGSSLTVNNSARIILINGAQAKHVFWAAFASSTLGSNVSFQGSVLAGASNSVGTGSTVVGRLLCTTGQITLLANTITLPPL